MAFDNVRFPVDISLGSVGGPTRRTEIIVTGSGAEERNSRWADSKRVYNAGYGMRTVDDVHTIIAFFEERRGQLHGFRWKDHRDFKSCSPVNNPSPLDQALGTGNGTNAAFQLVKKYGTGLRDYIRTITKPVAGTVRAAINGIETSSFSVNSTTGIITFAGGSIPGARAAVTAGFEFDVPVRFDTDELRINMAFLDVGDIPEIPIVEIRA
jgi:uncharacterized protein (TIGR02217 family)